MNELKDILVVIDMQKDFVTGPLGNERAQSIVEKVNERIAAYHNAGKHIIYTMDTHYDDYMDTVEGKHLPVKHCIKYSDGWRLAVDAAPNSTFYYKETFGSRMLGEYFKDFNGEVEICGVCTGICVLANFNIIKAFNPNIEIYINEPLCGCVTKESHDNAIAAMELQQANIIKE